MKARSPTPSVRSLGRALGLSQTTVADALKGSPRVKAATVQRVLQAADEAGYRRNPLVGAMMSDLRYSSRRTFRGEIAAVAFVPAGESPRDDYHRALVRGARRRATQLGFTLKEFVREHQARALPELEALLRARNIHGLLVLPSHPATAWSQLEWSRYAALGVEPWGFDARSAPPLLARIGCDQEGALLALLERLGACGYRRPGLCLSGEENFKKRQRLAVALRVFSESQGESAPVPPLLGSERGDERFEAWFRQFEPDVVLGEDVGLIDAMERCGARVPATHGFASLDVQGAPRACAGLDPQPLALGRAAVEIIVAQLQRNDRGVSEHPATTLLAARWVDGPTVRSLGDHAGLAPHGRLPHLGKARLALPAHAALSPELSRQLIPVP